MKSAEKKQYIVCVVLMTLIIVSCYIVFLVSSEEVIRTKTKEDGLFEYIGALSLLITSLLFVMAFLRQGGGADFLLFKANRNYWFLIFAFFFLLGSGEEISWGQRIFGWDTTEGYSQVNRQNETNIHNLKPFRGIFSPNYLFTYFWMSFCVIIPIVNAVSLPILKLIGRTGFPMVPLKLGLFLLIGYIPSVILKATVKDALIHSVTEVKETCLSILFIFIGIYFLRKSSQEMNDKRW
jgi:hypothetical protein